MKDDITFDSGFAFDEKVASCFDDMLERSIPDYENMRDMVFAIGSNFAKEGDTVVDLGSSLGRAYELFAYEGRNVVSCDISEPMIKRQKELFSSLENVDIRLCDITEDYPKEEASLVLSVLTTQFLPVEKRQRLIYNMAKSLKPGGAAIVVEKVLGGNAEMEDLLVKEYYRGKRERGYKESQIETKREALAYKMAPLTDEQNRAMFLRNGFSCVECFWRNLNFAAYLLTKQ